MTRWVNSFVGSTLVGLCIASCSRKPEPAKIEANDTVFVQARDHYAAISSAMYEDALAESSGLNLAIDELLRAPSQASLQAAQRAWVSARVPYRKTEALRFYGGPVDELEIFLNTWPIDEQFVESTLPGQEVGVINQPKLYPELSTDLLLQLNGRDGETSISTGFHVVEFLLWGVDTSTQHAGTRGHLDYDLSSTQDAAQKLVIERRRTFLKSAAELLQTHLEQVAAQWRESSASNYRTTWQRQDAATSLAFALTGMGVLSGSELAGERMTVAYETKDQENEHSCFSDTTTDDIVGNIEGLEHLCSGSYSPLHGTVANGPGVCDAVAKFAPELAQTIRSQITAAKQAAQSIPAPFDSAILGSDATPARIAIKTTIERLRDLSISLSQAHHQLVQGQRV